MMTAEDIRRDARQQRAKVVLLERMEKRLGTEGVSWVIYTTHHVFFLLGRWPGIVGADWVLRWLARE
jgi:hypothetical protein